MLNDMTQPWLSIIGIGEDGLAGMAPGARLALDAAHVVVGGRRHLDLVATLGKQTLEWALPFRATIPQIVALRGTPVAVLASGDPFWHGAGASLADDIPLAEMRVFPAPSTFSLAAARLGWRLEETVTLGLHARPLVCLRPHLRPGNRLLVLLRDGAAVPELAALLVQLGFEPSEVTLLERLGGPLERVRRVMLKDAAPEDIAAPVAVAILVRAAPGALILPVVSGLPDEAFEHDGQLTKREIRAITLSTLAPRGHELLWDIGAGAGSLGIEWLLAHLGNRAIGIEARADRLERARHNAHALGVPQLDLRLGEAPEALADLPVPDAIFIGGGAGQPGIFEAAWAALPPGGRLVMNAVTLETEARLIQLSAVRGGTLTRIAIERAAAVGRMTAWRAAMPVVQWSVTK
jgi:precorrin-6B C5,15-methyltransferase / cobalt-precorrin-6B C5,C15-methyltransferase